jgi:hypothetical protein
MDSLEVNNDKLLFTSYQHGYLFEKATLLKGIIDDPVPILDSIQGNGEIKFKNYNAITSHLETEIHFTMYHALESMFAMAFALIKQPNSVWVWLTTYSFPEFGKMINDVSKSNISSISEKDELETIKILFFKNCSSEFVEQEETIEMMRKLSHILQLCARELNNKNAYNSYKHGLRIVTGDIKLKLANEKEEINDEIGERPGFVYLDKKSSSLVPELYSFERSYKIIRLCWQMTSLMINQRKIEYIEEDQGVIETTNFNDINIEDIFGKDEIIEFFDEVSRNNKLITS